MKVSKTMSSDLKLLLATALLVLLIYAKEYTWAWFGSTGFWIVGFSLILACFILIVALINSLYGWAKTGFKDLKRLGIYLLVMGLLCVAIYGMR